jgi:hypothetical protein
MAEFFIFVCFVWLLCNFLFGWLFVALFFKLRHPDIYVRFERRLFGLPYLHWVPFFQYLLVGGAVDGRGLRLVVFYNKYFVVIPLLVLTPLLVFYLICLDLLW